MIHCRGNKWMNNLSVMLLSTAAGRFGALFSWAKDWFKVTEYHVIWRLWGNYWCENSHWCVPNFNDFNSNWIIYHWSTKAGKSSGEITAGKISCCPAESDWVSQPGSIRQTWVESSSEGSIIFQCRECNCSRRISHIHMINHRWLLYYKKWTSTAVVGFDQWGWRGGQPSAIAKWLWEL